MKKIVLLALLLVSFAGRMMAEETEATTTDKITSSIASSSSGWDLSIKLSNSVEYVAFQMDIALPSTVTVTGISGSSRLTDKDFILASNCIEEKDNVKTYRVLAYNLGNDAITGTPGEVLFTVALSSSTTPSVSKISKILFVKKDALKEIEISYSKDLLLGDADNSGEVDVTDISAVVSYIYHQPLVTFNLDAADVDGSKEIDVTDISGIVDIIYHKTPATTANRPASSNVKVYLPSVTVLAGDVVRVPIYIDQAETVSAFQFDLSLPQDIVATGVGQSLDNRPGIGGYLSDNMYRVMSYSSTNDSYFDSSYPVAYITLNTDQNLAPGVYEITMSSAVVAAYGEGNTPEIVNGKVVVVDPTSITNIDAENDKNTQIVSVSGVKVSEKQPKNVYIVNGKKQIEK